MRKHQSYLHAAMIFIAGVILGVMSKFLDETPSNELPYLLEVLDLRNFFSRMGIWMFLALLISLYSKTPVRAAVHVFLFFTGMVGSYYLYTILIAGFFPGSYMMLWVVMTVVSPFMAFAVWYAKGEGMIAVSISSIILLFMCRQAFVFGMWYFSFTTLLDLILWVATLLVLYQSPKQITKVAGIGLVLFFLTAQVNLFWGML